MPEPLASDQAHGHICVQYKMSARKLETTKSILDNIPENNNQISLSTREKSDTLEMSSKLQAWAGLWALSLWWAEQE